MCLMAGNNYIIYRLMYNNNLFPTNIWHITATAVKHIMNHQSYLLQITITLVYVEAKAS